MEQWINTSHACPTSTQTEHKDTATFFTFFQEWTKYTKHFRPSQTWLFNLSSLHNHCTVHRKTASLTWLMKRLLRFSLTVKTKDITEMLHTCTRTTYKLPRTRPLCGPILPPTNVPSCSLTKYENM